MIKDPTTRYTSNVSLHTTLWNINVSFWVQNFTRYCYYCTVANAFTVCFVSERLFYTLITSKQTKILFFCIAYKDNNYHARSTKAYRRAVFSLSVKSSEVFKPESLQWCDHVDVTEKCGLSLEVLVLLTTLPLLIYCTIFGTFAYRPVV